MVRRLKADSDARQLGLFGEVLALGLKPTVVRILPTVTQARKLHRRSSLAVTARLQADKSAHPRNLGVWIETAKLLTRTRSNAQGNLAAMFLRRRCSDVTPLHNDLGLAFNCADIDLPNAASRQAGLLS